MDKRPTISVLITVYNGQSLLGEAIASVLAQDCTDFELIVVDDGSTDGSGAVIDAFALQDRRIRKIRQDNKGVIGAANTGIDAAGGRYLARLDADDRMRPQRLGRQLDALQADPQRIIVGSAYQEIDELGNLGTIHRPPEHDTEIRWRALFFTPFAQPGVMMHLEKIKQAGLRYSPPDHSEDYAFFSRLLEAGRGYNLPDVLTEYRIHPGQATQVNERPIWAAATKVSQRNLERLGFRFSEMEVESLRRWQGRLPQELSEEKWKLSLQMIDIARRFRTRPDVDGVRARLLLGQWVLRLLRASRAGDSGRWRAVFQKAGAAGLSAAAFYALERMRRRSE